MDPSDIRNDGPAEDARAEPHADGRAQLGSPGSLMSLKIRKRTAATPARPGAPQSPQVEPSLEPAPAPAAPGGDSNSMPDAISRVTRRAQSALAARPSARPQPPVRRAPKARAPIAQPAREPEPGAGAPAPRHSDIVAYWTRLRGARRFPNSTEIDAATIAETWPNSILIRCRPGSRALEPDKMFLAGEGIAPGLSGLRGGARVNLSPLMLQWLLGLAGEVVREGRPMNDVETFPSVKRVVRYRAVALPFSENERAVDHVLCHFRPET